jgi:hypothetical protein
MPHGRVEIGADREFDFFALAIVVGTVGLFVMGVFSKNRSADPNTRTFALLIYL